MMRPTAVRLASLACMGVLIGACAARTVPSQPSADPPAPPVAAAPTSDTALPPDPAPLPEPAPPPETSVREADAPVAAECALLTMPGAPIRTVALHDTVDASHAPHPTNEGERLLFRQLYDTLVRVDCEGRLRPGLAKSWRLDQTGRTWIVTLDEQARFSDGTPVTSADILSSWGEPGPDGVVHRDAFLESVVPVNKRVIGVTLRTAGADGPRALADAALAIARRQPGVAWPLGTTAFRVIDQRAGSPRGVSIVRIALGTGSPAGAEPEEWVRFLIAPGMDPRDRLDEQTDLLVSSDPSVLAYASTRPDFMSVPLPWLRTHVLLSPARGSLHPDTPAPPALTPAARRALADDAVRGEARGAEGPFWWESFAACASSPPVGRSRSIVGRTAVTGTRIVLRASDSVAADLAERLVGLTAFDDAETTGLLDTLFPAGPAGLWPAGLADVDFDVALAGGRDGGYVVGLDRRPLDPCQQLRALTERAGWVARAGGRPGAAVVPLVDTRARAVVRRGRAGVTVDWDGGLVLDGVRAARP